MEFLANGIPTQTLDAEGGVLMNATRLLTMVARHVAKAKGP